MNLKLGIFYNCKLINASFFVCFFITSGVKVSQLRENTIFVALFAVNLAIDFVVAVGFVVAVD